MTNEDKNFCAENPAPGSRLVAALEQIAAFREKDGRDPATREWNRAGAYAREIAEAALNNAPDANPQLAALEEIKYLCCTAGAPGYIQVSKALAKMLAICNRAGVTKKLDELRPIYASSSEVK